MSKYTTEVRFICESAYENDEDKILPKRIDNIIISGVKYCFCERIENEVPFYLPLFQIYKSEHFDVLCSKILRHYYFNEIGFETVAQWKHFLITKMREIMPYYNGLYESADMKFNPFDDVNFTKIGLKNDEGKIDKNRTKNEQKLNVDNATEKTVANDSDNLEANKFATGENTNKISEAGNNLYSDTPQNGLSGVRSGNYLTNATATDSEKTEKNNDINNEQNKSKRERENTINTDNQRINTSDGKEDEQENIVNKNDSIWNETVRGKMGSASYSKLLTEYRSTIINIDEMIVNELKDLFMLLW